MDNRKQKKRNKKRSGKVAAQPDAEVLDQEIAPVRIERAEEVEELKQPNKQEEQEAEAVIVVDDQIQDEVKETGAKIEQSENSEVVFVQSLAQDTKLQFDQTMTDAQLPTSEKVVNDSQALLHLDMELEKGENRPQSSQEAGYETPPDDYECMSQVEKHQGEDDDEDDEEDFHNFDEVVDKPEQNALVGEIVDSAVKDYQQLYSEEEMVAVTTVNNTLATENRRLKAKLAKAKSKIETLTQKHISVHETLKAMEDKQVQQIERNSALCHQLDDIRRNQNKIDKSEVTDILARVKVAGVGYTLLQENSGKIVWHADQQIVKIQEQLYNEWKNVLQVVYDQVLPEKKRLESELEVQTQKHQERLQRLNYVVEKQNLLFIHNKEELKQAQETFELGQKASEQLIETRNSFFSDLIKVSLELQAEIQETLSENEINGAQLAMQVLASSNQKFEQLHASEDDPTATQIRALVASIFQTTVAALINANINTVAAMNESIAHVSEIQKQAVQLEVARGAQTEDQILQLQAKHNVLKCQKQLSQDIDIEHLRYVFMSYHTNLDEAIKQNSLKVLFKALSISDEEKQRIQEAQRIQQQSNKGWFSGRFF